MKKDRSQRKRNHHFLPRLYLEGFVEGKESPFVWVYERDKAYNPGHKKHNNPCRRPISSAGSGRDYYACTKRDGTTDFDTYENRLEKLEKPADPVFQKIREHKMITSEEKNIFASYVYLMHKRVPRRKQRVKDRWPIVFKSVSLQFTQWINTEESSTDVTDVTRLEKLLKLRDDFENYVKDIEDSPSDEILLDSMVMDSPLGVPDILCRMTWQFLVAPKGHSFLTGDDPVFYFGIDKPYSEITFPISTDIVLVMSRYKEIQEGFFPTNPEVVKEVNRRTISRAMHHVYHSRAASWVVDLLREKSQGFYLLYPYSGKLE